jgi:hypothetical protein
MKPVGLLALMTLVSPAAAPACPGQIEGQFHPEKEAYFVQEPVFVVLDLNNRGPLPVWLAVSCAWLDTRFEAPTASKPHPSVSLFGCMGAGTAGSCGGSARLLLPGEHYTQRYLLEGVFQLDGPGIYPIRAWHRVELYADGTSYRTVASQEVTTEFELSLVAGSEEELASAYAPIMRNLKSPDPMTSSMARSAVVENPPPLLEDVILAMADDPSSVGDAVSGLERFATPRAKAKLAELSGAGNPEGIRQRAITALGGLGDPGYCSLMRDIAQESREYSRFIALRAAGYLCGEAALPLLARQLAQADPSQRFEVAFALGNSHSRRAVPLLIPLLLDPDPDVRRAARESLAALTHRRSKDDERPPPEVHRDWTGWWASHAASAPIYGIDECKESEPLP